MFMDKRGLNLSNTGLRHYLGMKKELVNFHCYRQCDNCYLDDDGICVIHNLRDEFDVLFKELVV